MSNDAAKAKAAMTATVQNKKLTNEDFLSWGLTPLNLACYNRVFGGLVKGSIYRVIGKSQSAKSFLCRSVLAEAANNPNFDDYLLEHDDIEHGVLLDNFKFFGQKLADRIRAPEYDKKGNPVYSTTIVAFYDKLRKKLEAGKRLIRIVDSQDALLAEDTTKMGDGKAKIHADQLRKLIDPIKATGSIMIFVHHSKVNVMSMWGGDYTTGGQSPEYYSTLDIRLTKLKKLYKIINGKKFAIGNQIMAHVTKNRLTGMDRVVKFPLFIDYGLDDLGACIDWLLEAGHWKKSGGSIVAEEMDFEGSSTRLVKHIEKTRQERELRILTGKVWKEIESQLALKRKPKYN